MSENTNGTGSARDEAERLVAAALAAASVAARGITRNLSPLSGVADAAERLLAGGTEGHVATGSPECCVCPLCRAIAAVRDPSPELAFKLAVGASDLASGLTGVLRSVSDLVGRPPTPDQPARGARPRTAPDPAATWRAATAHQPVDEPVARPVDEQSAQWVEPDDPWHAATTVPVPPAGTGRPGDDPVPPDAP